MGKEEVLNEIINIPGVVGAVLYSTDLEDHMAKLSLDIDEKVLGGLGVSIIGFWEEIANSLEMGDIEEMIVETKRGRFLIYKILNYVLIILTTKAGNLGTIKYNLNKAIKHLRTTY